MKKVILFLCVVMVSSIFAADEKPLTKDEQEFNREVIKKLDDKISGIYQRLNEVQNTKASGGTKSLDATSLPLMQGSYTITKNGKPLLSEVYAQDSGNGEMYLNKSNNMIISTISNDHTTYKIGGTTVKTPVVYNNATPKASTVAIKPEINTVSQTNSSSNFLAPPPALPTKKEDF